MSSGPELAGKVAILAAALAVIIALFRFNAVRSLLGKYVQEQLFICIIWAGPLLALATAVAVLFVAMSSAVVDDILATFTIGPSPG